MLGEGGLSSGSLRWWRNGAARFDAFIGDLEVGTEKAAIYGIWERFLHVAGQLPLRRWTSKLGKA